MSRSYTPAACPVCSAKGRTLATGDELRAEVEALWGYHLRRLRPGTPVRHLHDRVAFTQRPPLALASCDGCGTLFRDPAERARATVEAYAGEALDRAVLESLLRAQARFYRAPARRLTRLSGKRGRGIEVGSYVGAFLAAAAAEGWSFTGVDVSESANRFAREHGASVVTGTLETMGPAGPLDAVAVWNCFEQLPAPRATLRTARRLLAPGGILALRVPNGAFYARLRRLLDHPTAPAARAILASNNLLGFPYRHGFTPASLRRLVEEEGFRTVRLVPDTLVPTADRWTRPWAALEERLLKGALRAVSRWATPPWLELYARRLPA